MTREPLLEVSSSLDLGTSVLTNVGSCIHRNKRSVQKVPFLERSLLTYTSFPFYAEFHSKYTLFH